MTPGMKRIFNKNLYETMESMVVDPRMGNTSDKIYLNNKGSSLKRIDRTLATGISHEPLVRHFYYQKNNGGRLYVCRTKDQIKELIVQIPPKDRQYFFEKYALEKICIQLIRKVNFANPEETRMSIENAVTVFLSSRYTGTNHPLFTPENIQRWKLADSQPNSVYNDIRRKMIVRVAYYVFAN